MLVPPPDFINVVFTDKMPNLKMSLHICSLFVIELKMCVIKIKPPMFQYFFSHAKSVSFQMLSFKLSIIQDVTSFTDHLHAGMQGEKGTAMLALRHLSWEAEAKICSRVPQQ